MCIPVKLREVDVLGERKKRERLSWLSKIKWLKVVS